MSIYGGTTGDMSPQQQAARWTAWMNTLAGQQWYQSQMANYQAGNWYNLPGTYAPMTPYEYSHLAPDIRTQMDTSTIGPYGTWNPLTHQVTQAADASNQFYTGANSAFRSADAYMNPNWLNPSGGVLPQFQNAYFDWATAGNKADAAPWNAGGNPYTVSPSEQFNEGNYQRSLLQNPGNQLSQQALQNARTTGMVDTGNIFTNYNPATNTTSYGQNGMNYNPDPTGIQSRYDNLIRAGMNPYNPGDASYVPGTPLDTSQLFQGAFQMQPTVQYVPRNLGDTSGYDASGAWGGTYIPSGQSSAAQ